MKPQHLLRAASAATFLYLLSAVAFAEDVSGDAEATAPGATSVLGVQADAADESEGPLLSFAAEARSTLFFGSRISLLRPLGDFQISLGFGWHHGVESLASDGIDRGPAFAADAAFAWSPGGSLFFVRAGAQVIVTSEYHDVVGSPVLPYVEAGFRKVFSGGFLVEAAGGVSALRDAVPRVPLLTVAAGFAI